MKPLNDNEWKKFQKYVKDQDELNITKVLGFNIFSGILTINTKDGEFYICSKCSFRIDEK